MEKKFITTTLPYINSVPHIGHLFEFILADVYSRFYKSKLGTNNVIFNVGVDEHGIKIQKVAESLNLLPQNYCDKLSETWKEFCKKFNIGYDNFYRTTDEKHKKIALKYFNDLKKSNFIYEDVYKGWYCEGCESFITQKEIAVDNKCPVHNIELKKLEEKNWFLNLSLFKDKIKNVLGYSSKELDDIKENFDKISITRQGIEWGIKTDESTTLYVWFEALLNYIIAAGYPDENSFEEYWKTGIIFCGQDNLKFQAFILQVILLANNVPQNAKVFVHGTILDAEGKKISKTTGNVIDPIEQLNKFGQSPVRWYLLSHGNNEQIFYNENELINVWNTKIVNGYGNLISRVLHLIDIKNVTIDKEYLSEDFKLSLNISESTKLDYWLSECAYYSFFDYLSEWVNLLNKRINDERPFDKKCEDYVRILNEIYFSLEIISKYVGFILPEYSDQIQEALSLKKKTVIFNKIENIELETV